MKKHDKGFEPAFMKLATTNHRLTGTAGLGTLIEAFHRSELARPFTEALPKRSSYRSRGSYCLGLTQVASFLAGHDCLDDLNEFRSDPSLERLFKGETVAPRTMGDFLRDFDEENFQRLNRFLAAQAKSYRQRLNGGPKNELKPSLAPRWNLDSTSHVQHGVKMEGVAWNYKNDPNRWISRVKRLLFKNQIFRMCDLGRVAKVRAMLCPKFEITSLSASGITAACSQAGPTERS